MTASLYLGSHDQASHISLLKALGVSQHPQCVLLWPSWRLCQMMHTRTHTPMHAHTGVVPGSLYLGSQYHASLNSLLKVLVVTHILNVRCFS